MSGPWDDDYSDGPWADNYSEPKKADITTAIKTYFANAGNTADTALSTLAGSGAALFGDTKEAVDIEESMRDRIRMRRQWSNPQNEELSYGGKLTGLLATLPMQIAGAGLSPAETALHMKDSGETTTKALQAAGIDAVGNAVGMVLPGFKQGSMAVRAGTGFGVNAAQDYATKLAIKNIAETEEAKKIFAPSLEDASLAGILGGTTAAAAGKTAANRKRVKGQLDSIKAKQAEVEAAQAPVAPAKPKEISNLSALEDETGQMSLFDMPDMVQNRQPYQAEFGDWRIDENGIPVKSDLSMEALNLQEPLQRSLWGDELLPKAEQEAPQGITQAMDMTRDMAMRAEDLPAADVARQTMDAQINLLRGEIDAPGELKSAKMEADGWKIPKGQRGAVNPEVFKEGFQKLKQLADGTWLRAYTDHNGFNIEARRDGHIVGNATFDPHDLFGRIYRDDPKFDERLRMPEAGLQSFSTEVPRGERHKGIATEMYKFASELGNDIDPSTVQTAAGRAMWSRWNEKGVAPGNRIPRKQRGAIDLGPKKQKKIEQIVGKDNKHTFIPDDPDVKSGLEVARSETDGKSWNSFESGSTLAAMKRASTAVQMASDLVQNAFKRSDLEIRDNVHPAEKSLRSLDIDELTALGEVFKAEMFAGKRFDPNVLTGELSSKQMQAYIRMRQLFEDTLRIQNEARAAKGQEPVTELEAYLSSRWAGDFRMPVYQAVLDELGNPKFDGEGHPQKKLVWYLAGNSRGELKRQADALKKAHPDLEISDKNVHVVRFFHRKTDFESQYSTLLDILGRDDPAVARIRQYIEDTTVGKGATMLNQEKHFKDKGNIRGFVGDRPEYTRFFVKKYNTPKQEAMAMFEQQMQYAKNAYRWSEMQKAGLKIKDIISDPELNETQPNNVKYIREYFKNNIGYGESAVWRSIEDTVRDWGVSPNSFNEAVGKYKTFFIMQKLAASIPYTAANFIALVNVLPHMADLYGHGQKGNPFTAVPIGIIGGLTMGTGHYLKYLGVDTGLPGAPFLDKAFRYAEDNGITSRSIYDEAPIDTAFSTTGRIAQGLGKTLTVPETYVRGVAFMTFAQYLKSTGKYTDDMKLFQEAERRTNASMVDYRGGERPMIFAKMGSVGNAANVLQTYGWNFYQQWNYFTREAAKGNPAPLMTALLVAYGVAGAQGLPYADDLYRLYMWLVEKLPTKYYVKAKENPVLADPKLWLASKANSAVYGVLSDATGLGLTSRLSVPGVSQMVQNPLGPPMDIAEQVKALGEAVVDPTNTTKWAQSAMKSTPVGLQGLLETAPFMEGKTYDKRTMKDGSEQIITQRLSDMSDHRGVYARSQKEHDLRKTGFRSQREVETRDATYSLDRTQKAIEKRLPTIVDDFYDAAKRGDKEKARELNKLYVQLTGKGISQRQLENQLHDNYLTQIEKSRSAAKSVSAFKTQARMKAILDEIAKDNPQE